MKKLKLLLHFSKNKEITRKVLLYTGILCSIIISHSCSNEDESTGKSGINKTAKESDNSKKKNNAERDLPFSVQENLNLFSEQVSTNAQSLETALNRNENVKFNAQAMQKLSTATNENDLKSVFEMAGIINSQEVLNLLKNNVSIQQQFIAENPDFYNLTIEKRVELLDFSFALIESNYFSQIPLPSSGFQAESSCSKTWARARGRCLRDYTVCSVGSVTAAFIPPFWPALVVAATCLVGKINCESDAKEDWLDCKPTEIIVPKPTGELTIHCTAFAEKEDSCWTTDSNGKYVGRVK